MVALHQQLHRLAGRVASLLLDLEQVQERSQYPKGRAILRYQQGIEFHKPELMALGCGSKVTAVINRSLPSEASSRIGTADRVNINCEISPWGVSSLKWERGGRSLRCPNNGAIPLRKNTHF